MRATIIVSKIKKVIYIACWIIIWQVVYLRVGKDVLVPSPIQTSKALIELAQEASFYINIIVTCQRVVWGTSISLIVGLMLGIMVYLYPVLKPFFEPIIVVMKSTPIMAIIILALLWFKSNDVPIFVCFLMCCPIVYTNTVQNLGEIDQNLLELIKLYHVKMRYLIKSFYWPYISSCIQSTLCLVVGMSWKVVIAAEVLAIPKYAMGYELLEAKIYLETERVFAWVIVIILLSKSCESIIRHAFGRNKIYDSN